MTITSNTKPKLKLIGADGNAFAILGKARRAWKDAGLPADEWDAVRAEMTSGDYDCLLGAAMKYFDVE